MDAEPREQQKEAALDRPDGFRAGWYIGTDALPLVRRFLWGAAGAGGLGVLLLGAVVYDLRAIAEILRAIEQVLRGR